MLFNKEALKYLALFGTLGLTMIVNILVAIGLYKLIDKFLGLGSNILFIIFVIMGVVSGFYSVYKYIMK